MIDWRHWHNEPLLVGGLVLLGWLWAVCAGPLRARLAPGEPFPRRQAGWFYGSLVVFYLAVGSPLDQVGERFLFAAHMFQHEIIIYPAAMMFLIGIPSWVMDRILGAPALRRPLQIFFHPLTCAVLSTLVLSIWHAPWLYDWALQNKVIHVIEHLMFFAAAIHYWWPILSPSKLFPRSSYGAQMLYLFGVEVLLTPLFAYITFSPDVLYPTYEYAPRLFANFGAGDDQLLAGVMMKLISMFASLAVFGVAFFRWSAANERHPKRA